jgi:hypothetical protein
MNAPATTIDARFSAIADGKFEHAGGFPVPVLAVKPAKVLAFAKGSFSVTRHVF